MRIAYFLSFLLISCTAQSPEEKAKSAVKAYLKANLKNSGSYTPGEFKVTEWRTKATYKEDLPLKLDSLEKLHTGGVFDMATYWEKADSIKAKNIVVAEKLQGYRVQHAYRAKNGFGGLDIGENTFFMDTLFNVLEVKEGELGLN